MARVIWSDNIEKVVVNEGVVTVVLGGRESTGLQRVRDWDDEWSLTAAAAKKLARLIADELVPGQK